MYIAYNQMHAAYLACIPVFGKHLSSQGSQDDETVPEKDRKLGIGGNSSAIPSKYSNPETSGLKETIDGSRTIDIVLAKE
jgi:hypothetical protein